MGRAGIAMLFALGCRWNFDAVDDGGGTRGDADVPTDTRVQRGTLTMGAGNASIGVPIDPVVPAHTMLVFSVSAATRDPADGLVEGVLGAANVTFARAGSVGAVAINWQVIETPLVDVQHGIVPMPGAGIPETTVTIAPVDVSRSFVIRSLRNGGTGYDEDDYVKVKLTAPTTLQLQAGNPAAGGRLPAEVAYQIVTLRDGMVESGDAVLLPTESMKIVPVTSAMPQSVPWLSFKLDADVGDVGSASLVALNFPGDLRIFRSQTALDVTATWFVASSPSFRVQQGAETFVASELMRFAPITAVDTARSFVVVTGAQTQYLGSDPMDFVGNAWFRGELASTGVTLTRGDAQAMAQVGWAVVSL